ncbi:tripartite tricarboxylate transporter substrate binding protein [soil metagenome]
MLEIDARRRLICGATLAAIASTPLRASSADAAYPNRPITLVVPYGAGSSTDILARVIATRMSNELKQPVIVEDRAGAGGTIGSMAVARAAPDGYTLVMGTISSHSINASMMRNIPYKVLDDFQPISLVAYFPNVLAVSKDLPANNIEELVALARKRGGLNFATGGVGSSGQLAGELLKLRTGAPLVHVPYKDIGQGITDTIAGHVPIVIYQVPALVSHIQSGDLKAIAVLAPQRTTLLPNVATPGEQGIKDFDATAWMGLFGPAKLPSPITAVLQKVLAQAAADPQLAKQLAPQGFTLVGSTPPEFRRFLETDIAKWADVVKATGATID